MRQWKRILIICLIALLLGATVLISVGASYFQRYASCHMDLSLLELQTVGIPSKLYYYEFTDRATRQGVLKPVKDQLPGVSERTFVPYSDMPEELLHAFVAIEDKRFFSHRGVDLPRTVLAGARYMMGGEKSFGASTITQQLIKNLTGRSEYTLDRKFTEIFEALDLERHVDKETILEAYLNIINLANGCEGVGEAAQYYFQKSVSELSLSECAIIAAITNNPARYDPVRHPDETLKRRNLILRQMAEQGYITDEACDTAIRSPIQICDTAKHTNNGNLNIHSWYTDMVIEDVIRDLMATYGYTRRQASVLVYEGDLTIHTAMDPNIQSVVEEYYKDPNHFPIGERGTPQSALIVIDPHTGDILGVAGAVGEKSGNRIQNFATDTKRPVGSTIKPLSIYAPAIEKGLITWSSLWEDAPLTSDEIPSQLKQELANGDRVWPRNADGLYRGKISVYEALCQSVNTVAVKILQKEGLSSAFNFLRDRLHMDSLLSPSDTTPGDLTYSSMALGQQSYGMTVRELTGGYTVFQNGVYRKPISYYRVIAPDGTVLLSCEGNGEIVLKEETAALMTRMLQGVMREGSASSSTFEDRMGIEAAGKTGTTQRAYDRWFVGYTPRLLAGVWMGYEYPSELSGISQNPCVGIWDEVLKRCEQIYDGRDQQDRFTDHPGLIRVTYCEESGLLPDAGCLEHARGERLKTGWFIKGTEPRRSCGDEETEDRE